MKKISCLISIAVLTSLLPFITTSANSFGLNELTPTLNSPRGLIQKTVDSMNQDALHMLEAPHSTRITTGQNNSGAGVTLCIRSGSIPVCHLLPDPVYLIASDSTDSSENTSEQAWLFNLDNSSQDAFKAWQKEHSPPDLTSYFNHGQTWWRGQIEITVDFSRNILSSESELPANLNVNHWLRLLTKITQVNDQNILDFGNAQEQKSYSEYEFRQFLALFFEWFLERYASYNFRPYIPSKKTDLPVPVLQTGKNRGKKTPKASLPPKKSGERSGESKKPVPKAEKPVEIEDQVSSGTSTCPTRECEPDDARMTSADQAIKNKKYDQAITKLLRGYGEHQVLETLDDLKLQGIQARMGQAVQGKLDRISETHIKKPNPSIAQLKTAFSQVSSLKLIPKELLSESIRSQVNRQISDIGQQAQAWEFEHLDLTPKTLQQNTERLYHLYRPIPNPLRLKFIGKHWLDTTGIGQQAELYLSLNRPIDAMRLLAQHPLMFNELVQKQDKLDQERIKAVYTRVIQESLSAMSVASANSHTDILLLEQLIRIHYQMNNPVSLLPHQSIGSIGEQLESLLAGQNSSESGQVITVRFTPFACPETESDTLTGSNFSDLIAQVAEMINSGDHARALGLTFSLMDHLVAEQAAMTTLSEILKLLITPVVYDLSNKIARSNDPANLHQRVKALYEATYHLRYYLNAELITRISWLHSHLPDPMPLTLPQPAPIAIVEPEIEKPAQVQKTTESTTDAGYNNPLEAIDDKDFTLVKRAKKKTPERKGQPKQEPPQSTKKEDEADSFFKRFLPEITPENPSKKYLAYFQPIRKTGLVTSAPPEPVSQPDKKSRPVSVKKPAVKKPNPWFTHKMTSEIAPSTYLPAPTQMLPGKGESENEGEVTRSDQNKLVTLHYLINLALESKKNQAYSSMFETAMRRETPPSYLARFLRELSKGTISCSELDNAWLLSLDLKKLDDVIKKSLDSKRIQRY